MVVALSNLFEKDRSNILLLLVLIGKMDSVLA